MLECYEYEQHNYLHVRAPGFELLPRPRLKGDDHRRPDVARTSFQSAVARSFVDKPQDPFESAVLTVAVPGGDALPAAGTLKSVIDAAVAARVLLNDRSALLAARLTKFDLMHEAQPMTKVEVVEYIEAETTYLGQTVTTPSEMSRRNIARSVVDPVEYADRSGIAGVARFQNPWVDDPEEYESQLRSRWRRLVDERCIFGEPDDWAALPLSARLSVHLPKTYTEDGDNALLYVVDMLEVALRDIVGADAATPTLDQSLVEVSFRRNLDRGIRFWLAPIEKHNQYPYYDTGEEFVFNPFDPDAL